MSYCAVLYCAVLLLLLLFLSAVLCFAVLWVICVVDCGVIVFQLGGAIATGG